MVLRALVGTLLLLGLSGPEQAFAAPKFEITPALTSDVDDLDDDLRELNEEVARDPGDLVAWRDLGIVQLRTGHPEDALRAFRRAEEGGLDDPYLAGFFALALELHGEAEPAASRFERAAEHFEDQSGALRARARLLRARARALARPVAAETTLALLPPVDLGGGDSDLDEDLAFGLQKGLETAVKVLGPAETEAVLRSEGRGMADLDDPARRDLAGRALHARGVSGLVSSSFLLADDGKLHLRLALLPVGAQGLGEALSVSTEAGSADAEFASLPAGIAGLAEHVGLELEPESVAPLLPAPADALRAYRSALDDLGGGRGAQASRSIDEAARRAPGAAAVVALAEDLRAVHEWLDDPIVTSLGRSEVVVEAMCDVAERSKRRKRRFDEH